VVRKNLPLNLKNTRITADDIIYALAYATLCVYNRETIAANKLVSRAQEKRMTEEYLGGLDSRQTSKPEERTETEVVAKPKRRQHTAEYKLRILRELDECTGKGEVGAILRREGLYSSLISKWREQREQGSLNGLGGQRRGPKVDPNAAELARLQRENKRLKEKLERAELIIDVQKKVARLIGETPPPPSEEN
jgi:transposase